MQWVKIKVEGLAAGESKTWGPDILSQQQVGFGEPTKTYRFNVDADNEIDETNENNNSDREVLRAWTPPKKSIRNNKMDMGPSTPYFMFPGSPQRSS